METVKVTMTLNAAHIAILKHIAIDTQHKYKDILEDCILFYLEKNYPDELKKYNKKEK